MRTRDVIGLVIGAVIGAGIFRIPASISSFLPFPGLILLAWAAGGGIVLSGAFVYGELARRFPDTGGDYTYINEAFSGPFGFLFAWTKIWIVQPASIAALSFIFAGYFRSFFPVEGLSERMIAASVIGGLALINIAGIQKGILLQNISTLLKAGSISFIALAAFVRGPADLSNLTPLLPASFELSTLQSFGLALLFVLWTYGGWNEGVFLAGEMRSPKSDLPKGLMGGVLILAGIYMAVNLAYHLQIPVHHLGETHSPAALLVTRLFGDWAGHWLSLLVAVCCFGALNSYILTGGRVIYAVSRDYRWLGGLTVIHPRFQTPARGIFLVAFLAFIMVFAGTFERLVVFESIIVWFFFLLVALALLKIFIIETKKSKAPPLWKWAPLWCYAAAGLGLVLNTALSSPWETLAGILLTLTGLPFFYMGRRKPNPSDPASQKDHSVL